MKISPTALLLALIIVPDESKANEDATSAALLAPLGTNSLEVYDYTEALTVDESDMYTLTITFTHREDIAPQGNEETCVPLAKAPEDDLPYLANRWAWDYLAPLTQKVTEFNHISIDYNACGHPPEAFLQPHYDLHLYLVTPEYRAERMVCPMLTTAPICDPTQEGHAFFQVSRSSLSDSFLDMPIGFEPDAESAVPHMGLHLMHPDDVPATRQAWDKPVLVYCTFDNQVTAFEPMVPFKYNHGTKSHEYEKSDIEPVEPTLTSMPNYYSLVYDADTGVTTFITKGKSEISYAEWKAQSTDDEPMDTTTSGAGNNNMMMTTNLMALLATTIVAPFLV